VNSRLARSSTSVRSALAKVTAALTRGIERHLESELSTWKVLVVLLAGAVFGWVVVFADFPWWDQAHRDFAGAGAFVLWSTLICTQTGLWGLALAWLLPSVGRLRDQYGDKNQTEVVASTTMILAIILALVIGGPSLNDWPDYVPHHVVKVGLLTLVGALVGLVAARGVWFVHGGLKQLTEEDLRTEKALKTFLDLQTNLDRFLGTLGAILGLLILSAGAQRRAVLAYAPNTDYGYELVLVYGFFFTILIAAIYLPTQLTLAQVGNGIRDAFFPVVPPTSAEWEDRVRKREKLGSLLDLQVGPLGRFKASAAILTPLLGSLIALLLK
jgi:hypothetical protein